MTALHIISVGYGFENFLDIKDLVSEMKTVLLMVCSDFKSANHLPEFEFILVLFVKGLNGDFTV